MSNTNFQTYHQMGSAINDVVRQATGRDNVQNIDMDYVTVAQNKRLVEKVITGDVVSFYTPTPTILDYLIAQINPVQDLHGYDNPWPGGGGKNLANFIDGYGLNTDGSIGVSTKRSATLTPIKIESGKSYVVSSVSASFIYAVFNGETLVRRVAMVTSGAVLDTSDGTDLYVCGYSGGDSPVTAEGNKLMVEEGTTPSATYAPYSNICPISGWTGANVTRTGKNLLKAKYSGRTNNGITYTVNDDGTITTSGTATATSYASPNLTDQPDKLTFLPAGTYTLTGGISENELVYIGGKYTDRTDLPSTYDRGSGNTFILTKPAYVYPQIFVRSGTSSNSTFTIQLELSSTASEYTPYVGGTYSITFPSEAGTVYGGTLTVNKDGTGSLVVDRESVTFNGNNSEGWNKYTSGLGGFYVYIERHKKENYADGVCDMFPTSKSINTPGVIYGVNSKYLYFIGVFEIAGETVADWRAWLAENPVTVIFKLDSPITYELTAQQIQLLQGTNNIWADTGNVTVMYSCYEEVI